MAAKVETQTQKQTMVTGPTKIIVAILVVVAIWIISPLSPATTVLWAVFGIFLFGLNAPLWAVAAIIVSELTISSYMVSTPFGIDISLRLLLVLLTALVLWRLSSRERLYLGPGAKGVLIPASILAGLSVIADLTNSGFASAFKDFRSVLAGLLIIVLLAAVANNLKDLKKLCAVILVGATASALVGIMQHYQFLGTGESTLIPGFLASWGGAPRVPGMAETELELSYVLSAAIPVAVGVYLARGVEARTRVVLVISMMTMALGLYFTYTRSALLALGVGLIALIVFAKTRIRGEIVLAALLLAVAFISVYGILEGNYLGGRTAADQDESTVSRKIVWQAGIGIVQDSPIFGIGDDRFLTVSPQYASRVDPTLLSWEEERYWGYRSLGSVQLHNDYLMIWVSYGTIALVMYLWLLVAVLRNFINSYRSSSLSFIRGLSVGLAAALVAYGVNAFYHNCLATMALIWILAGFSVVAAKLSWMEKTKDERTQKRILRLLYYMSQQITGNGKSLPNGNNV